MADVAAEIEEGGLKRTLKDLFAGAAGGIAQVLLGEFNVLWSHPVAYCFYFSIRCHVARKSGELV
jgi:hypothetical protein